MSLGWKRFTFFDQHDSDASLPDAVCSCSGKNQAFFGTASGEVGLSDLRSHHQYAAMCAHCDPSLAQVVVLDRSLQQVRAWQAHAGGIKQLCLLEVGPASGCQRTVLNMPVLSCCTCARRGQVSTCIPPAICGAGGAAVHAAHGRSRNAQAAELSSPEGMGRRQRPCGRHSSPTVHLYHQGLHPEAGRGRDRVPGSTCREAAGAACCTEPVVWPDPEPSRILPRCACSSHAGYHADARNSACDVGAGQAGSLYLAGTQVPALQARTACRGAC